MNDHLLKSEFLGEQRPLMLNVYYKQDCLRRTCAEWFVDYGGKIYKTKQNP